MLTIIIVLTLTIAALSSLLIRNAKKTAEISNNAAKYRKIIRELNITTELTASLLSSLDMNYIADLLLDRCKELLKAERSALILIDKRGFIQEFYSSLGPTTGCKSSLTGVLEKVYRDMIPIRGDDISTISGFKGFPKHHPDIGGIIIAPIVLGGETLGELIVANKEDKGSFTAEDEDLLLTIAFYCAFAIEKVKLHTEIMKMATTDGLTGLYNHRTFKDRLQSEIERGKRFGRSFSLLMLDIDHFKKFNDTYGHQVGDVALHAISKIMASNIRGIDMLARYGGEEFVIILTETNLQGALIKAERIRQSIENTGVVLNDGDKKKLTISIGVAEFPADGITGEEIIEASDKALYLAKRSGRNMIRSYRTDT